MDKLEQEHYKRIEPLFAGLDYNLVVASILDGHTPAWVYADQKAEPRRALLWNRQDAVLLAGKPTDATFNRGVAGVLAGKLIPDAQSRHIPELALFYTPQSWEAQIPRLLPGRQVTRAQRRYYRPGPTGTPQPGAIPAGYQVRPLDEELLRDEHLHNREYAAGWVNSFWPSAAVFAEEGFGYCVLASEDTVASWCLTVYKSGAQYELGVATAPAYRRRGLATLAAAACVDHARARGYVLHWHCWEDNVPSIAVAARVGFREPRSYTVYRILL